MCDNYLPWLEMEKAQIQTLGYLSVTSAAERLKISQGPADMLYPKRGVSLFAFS